MEDKTKKYFLIGSIILILIIAAFGINILKTKPNTLGNVINEFNEIDKKYDGDWRNERIELTTEFSKSKLMPLENINKAIEELKKLEQEINKQNLNTKIGLTTQGNLLQNFTQARILMLEAEKAFQESENIGDKGKINFYYKDTQIIINETINCNDKPFLIQTIPLLNQTLNTANAGKTMLDHILANSKEAKDLIGLNEKKPKFYDSRLDYIYRQIQINNQVAKDCKVF